MSYLPTIGLEVHVELKTATKMFCDCPNDPEEKHPNINVCPICLGHPGTLPTINKKALEQMIQIGLALGGKINKDFKFDRKNYFYPDLPKGYQISQYDLPVIVGGGIDLASKIGEKRIIKLNRIHLEEDAGKLVHSEDGESTFVDFNRCGVPLMELVSEPDLRNVKEAVAFARELQLVLRYLGVSDVDLEHGQMRVDANISIVNNNENIGIERSRESFPQADPQNKSVLGTKVEIKNLNSFRAIEDAINFEIQRQTELLENGGKIKLETRGWNDVKKKTISQRSKEEAQDYRYFPEPDLPPLDYSAFDLNVLKSAIPELPEEKRKRFKEQFLLSDEQVNILVEDRAEAEYFEEAVSELGEADAELSREKILLLFNYLNTDLKGLIVEQGLDFFSLGITPENFADLVELVAKKEISSRTAKDLLPRMLEGRFAPREIVQQEGLAQISEEGALLGIVRSIIEENPKAVEDYKKGKLNSLQFLIGKTMAVLKGRGNPEMIQNLFRKELL